MIADIFSAQVLASLLTLTLLEIVLGIDNIIFLSILASKLPPEQRPLARRLGLIGAMVTRLLLLASVWLIAQLTQPLITIADHAVSGRDLILLFGGFFLLAKATTEIHSMVEHIESERAAKPATGFMMVITQIAILDIVFSLDSVITAIGLANDYWVMATAIIIAVLVMMLAATPISGFIERHPTVKMLALAFLVLVGAVLVADGLHFHIPKAYVYVAIAFSIGVEALNIMMRDAEKRRAAAARNEPPLA